MFIKFNNTYVSLPETFFAKINPLPVSNPNLAVFNYQLAEELGIKAKEVSENELARIFSGNEILKGSEPIALVYAGHQFGYFVPQLGDGRAILLGEVKDRKGKQLDIQLKGSGRTPYSRSGDGRAALAPMIREYIVSEAMHTLGIKTTRCLALVTTGEYVIRNALLPGAILTRVASSHIRIGTFEYFASKSDFNSIKILADYAIERHYPQAKKFLNPYLSLLKCITKAQVSLIIEWMRVGFIHGVMNTDNTSISGETIDYGPCAFLDEYSAAKVFSSIDYSGRYAFSNQAGACFWNLMQLGKSIAHLIDPDQKKALSIISELIEQFKSIYKSKYLKTMGQKIGIIHLKEKDIKFIEELLKIMEETSAYYTLTFRYLCYAASGKNWPFHSFFQPHEKIKSWIENWRIHIELQKTPLEEVSELMFFVNPAFIPRNHKIEKVIETAQGKDNDFTAMSLMLKALSSPYTKEKGLEEYMRPPTPEERVCKTFCGT